MLMKQRTIEQAPGERFPVFVRATWIDEYVDDAGRMASRERDQIEMGFPNYYAARCWILAQPDTEAEGFNPDPLS